MAEHINLNNSWRYSKTFDKEMTKCSYDDSNMETIRLPHTNIETPYHYFDEQMYQFISYYRRRIEVKKEWSGKQVLLTFEGVGHVATVYLNGKKITTHYGGYTAFTVDLEPYLNFSGGSNVLAIEVDSRESNNLPPFGNVIDYLTYGGIYREVYLDIKEAVSIEDVFIITNDADSDRYCNSNGKKKYDLGIRDINKKVIDLQVKLHGLKQGEMAVLKLSITDSENQVILSDARSINELITRHRFKVEGVCNWEIDQPVLYYLHMQLLMDYNNDGHINKKSINLRNDIEPDEKTISLTNNTEPNEKTINNKGNISLDQKTIRFGFRTCEFKEDGFYLNSKKVKLIGLNRHQSFPYVGYAMPKRMQQRDAEILKQELKVNAVRTSHYPQSQHFINRCDELGLLVFTEIPGWQHIGDENWKSIACENVKDMVLQYRNHPSIILWGVRINESQDDDEFYTRTNSIAHELDPSRQTGGVRYLKKSHLLEDVYTYNDFLHNGRTKGLDCKKKVTSRKNAPYLVSEFNGHMFPTKAFDPEEHRLWHALRHACVLDEVFRQKDITGAFGWCMFDYNTHKDFGSGDRICYHGVMDMFRNPKLAAAVYASQNDEGIVFEISSSLDIGEHPAGDIKEVYAFTNADSVKLYKNEDFIKEFYPSKGKYSNLPHPPILIDDYIGTLLEEKEKFSHKTAEAIKRVLYAVKKYGPNQLPFRYKLQMAFLMLTEHLSMEKAANLFYKYIGGWGGTVTTFRIEAMKDNKVVKMMHINPVNQPILRVLSDTAILMEEETYDVAEVRIQVVDENNNRLPFFQEPVILEAWGTVELIGPKTVGLKGGQAGTYVKTIGRKGEGGLKVSQEGLGETVVHFTVL